MRLFALALAVRLLAFFVLRTDHVGEQTAHHEHASIAASVARGDGFRFNFFGPLDRPVLTSQQAPLVPYLLAGCYCLFGVETEAAFRAMILLQIALSAWTVVLLAATASQTTLRPSAHVGVGLAATFYPPLVISGLHVQALVFNLFWLALLLLATQQCRRGAQSGPIVFALASLGALHTDPIYVVVVACLFCLCAVELRRRPKRIGLGMVPLVLVIGMTPWTVRNYQVHGRLVFVKDSLPYVFWQGNNAISQGTDKLLVGADDARIVASRWSILEANSAVQHARLRSESVNSLLSAEFIAELQQLPTEIERMDRFARLAWEILTQNPRSYVRLCWQRLAYWLWFDETNPRSFLWHYRLSYVVLIALAVVGVFLSLDDGMAWTPMFLAGAALSVVHILIITSARFRIPMEMLYLFPVGIVLERTINLLQRRWLR